MEDKIIIKGAKEHNLKNVDLELPRNKFIVFTGLSGSGKTTLAFNTIFAEGQRRYLESLSSYARQFLGQMDKPDVEYIEGLSPAISIDQKSVSRNPRSTVGTVTEIHDYLRLLFSKAGLAHCPKCQKEISSLDTEEIVEKIVDHCTDGKKVTCSKIQILSPVVRDRKGEYSTLLKEMFQRGFSEAIVNKKRIELDSKVHEKVKLARYKKHSIDILIDEVEMNDRNLSRIFEDVEKATKLSQGIVKIKTPKSKELVFNQNFSCSIHDIDFPELEPRLFSFNSPFGACPDCEGLGSKKEIDPELIVPNKNLTISQGALIPWSYKKNNYQGSVLRAVTNYYHIPDNVRVRDLSKEQYEILIFGKEDPDLIPVNFRSKAGSNWRFNIEWKGIIGFLKERYFKTSSNAVREDIEKYMSQNPCSTCKGSRYKKEVLMVTFKEKNIDELSRMSIAEVLDFFKNVELNKKEKIIAGSVIKEIISRLEFLENVGLNYLTLSRSANTLAGGESQRIRLASQIGSQLVGVLYIMDEPSIGLHARDNSKLLSTLNKLRDLGNTLIVVEHDEETIRNAEHVVDIGPGAGKHGGEIVVQGTPNQISRDAKSLTGKYLSNKPENS